MANTITSIKLCNVPITPTHQLDFITKQEQENYFNTKVVLEYNKCKYQARTGKLRVKGYVDNISNCNYGFYTNTYNGTVKTFYFWIARKDYIAKETTELTIQLDVFQTWHFDFTLENCMIEREHVSNDAIGSNTLPEDFELGDYIVRNSTTVTELDGEVCYLLALSLGDMGGVFGKTYSGFNLIFYKSTDHRQLSEKIIALGEAGQLDSIAYISVFPKPMFDLVSTSLGSGDTVSGIQGILTKKLNFEHIFSNLFSYKDVEYIPKNKKLLTYPFNFCTIKNASGSNVVLKLELFNGASKLFKLDGVVSQNATFTLTPMNYAGKYIAYDDSISTDGFGLGSWNNDNYANWYAQHSNSIQAQSQNATSSYNANKQIQGNNYSNSMKNNETQLIKNSLATASNVVGSLSMGNIGGAIGGAISGGVNTALDYSMGNRNIENDLTNANLLNTTSYQNSIRSIMASVQDASVQPNNAKGDLSGSGLDVARGTNTFFIQHTQIRPEYAKMIDMYFQMYGYQVNRLGKPNMRSRGRWNYIKTVNATVSGNVPLEDREVIAEFLNNGLTIWHGESYMYNYDTVNNIK